MSTRWMAASSIERNSYIAGQNAMPVGTPVYVKQMDGKLYPTSSDALSTSYLIGLLAQVSQINLPVPVAAEILTLSDWTAIIGSQSLTPGAQYYLSTTPGQLTTIAPTDVGDTVTAAGQAASTETLEIYRAAPVLL